MPAYRTPKKAWANSSNANKNSFVPVNETLGNEVDEEYRTRATNDPYTHYILKTSKHRGKTLKQVHEEGRNEGYLNCVLNTPKACKDLDGDHIVKKGLLRWKEHASSAESAKTPTNPSSRRDSAASETFPWFTCVPAVGKAYKSPNSVAFSYSLLTHPFLTIPKSQGLCPVALPSLLVLQKVFTRVLCAA